MFDIFLNASFNRKLLSKQIKPFGQCGEVTEAIVYKKLQQMWNLVNHSHTRTKNC